MARIVKEYDERFTEFLDTAQALFFNEGYEQTSVQDIINQMGVAKGTFYHYFDSKTDLLEAVVKRNREHVLATVVMPVVRNSEWDALTKLEHFFGNLNDWKLQNHAMILDMMRMLYKDENILLRLKMHEGTRQNMTAPLAEIIEQGVAEGTFAVRYPHETAELVLRMCEMPSRAFIAALLDGQYDENCLEMIKREMYVFNRSIERVLGMRENTVSLIWDEDLTDWLAVLQQVALEKTG